jgi:hypothetical protein
MAMQCGLASWSDPQTDTLIFNFGAFVMRSDLLSSGGVVYTSEWLSAARENSLRLRNFLAAGLLATPTLVRALIYRNSDQGPAIGGLEILGRAPDVSPRSQDTARSFAGKYLRSATLRVEHPFEEPREIGLPLLESLSQAAGWTVPFKLAAERRLREGSDVIDTPEGVDVCEGLLWLLEGERGDRASSVFTDSIIAE